jgi:hypothetical protein
MYSFVREYFTQRGALERIAVEPATDRAARSVLVLQARQKAEAAKVVIAVSEAEALALMRDAVLLFEKAFSEGRGADQGPEAQWDSLGVDAKTVRRLRRTLEGLSDRSLPALDTDVSDADLEFFHQLAAVAAALNRGLTPRILQRTDIIARRLRRCIVAAGIGVTTVLVLAVAFRPLPCRVSGFLFEEFRCEMAIDGVAASEWLLPDGKPGWIDVRVSPSRDIRSVRLTNGHNRTSNDRAIRAYQVEAYSGRRLLNTASGEFPALLPAPQPIEVPLVAKGVDRVRLVVSSWFGAGGALAEIKVE